MIESRLAKIILLDGSQLDFHITPEILTSNLLDMVASYLSLKDKEYFGISYMDSTSHRNWLQLDKKVLDHDLPKKTNILVFFFRVKFYIESIALTKDKVAVELFYQQAKYSIFQSEFELSNELIYELTALVLQSIYGDYKSEAETLKLLKNQSILPKSFVNAIPNSSFREQKIGSYYKKCANMNRGQCIVNYLTIIEKLVNYGVHYYEVKDKSNIKWYLGISFRGIGLYEHTNKVSPKKIFLWSKLENLYYRDRKFSIEVHESLSQLKELDSSSPELDIIDESFNPVKVYAWFASIPSLCKSIWLMAVSQHQFYLDKKQNKDVLLQYKSLNDLANELSSTTSSNVNNSTNPAEDDLMMLSDDTYNEKSQMLMLLKKKQEILLNKLNIKKTFFNKIKSKHQDIIEFSKCISEDKACIYNVMSLIKDLKYTVSESQQNQCQVFTDEDIEIQRKIMYMALNLASDPAAPHLKARRDFYERAKKKFTKLENSKENKEYYDSCSLSNTQSSDHMSQLTSNSNNNSCSEPLITSSRNYRGESESSEFSNGFHQTKLAQYFNEDVVVDLLDSVSPASIHRKDSYRRAQEHKLFLEANGSKANRNASGKRVKNILNESKSQYNNVMRPEQQMSFIDTNYSKPNSFLRSNSHNNHILNINNGNSTGNVNGTYSNGNNSYTNGNHSYSNGSSQPQLQKVFANNLYDVKNFKDEFLDNNNHNNKAKSVSPNELLGFEVNNLEDKLKTKEPQTDIENLNSQLKNTEISIKADQIRNISQRKNTSDSNVKLLADHNFYHISNKITNGNHNSPNHGTNQMSYQPPLNISNITYRDSQIQYKNNGHNNNGNRYEITDMFRYNNKYRRGGGLNSSSNSLVSLNESSASPNEDLNHTNSDTTNTQLIRSNPDLNDLIVQKKAQLNFTHSPKILSPVPTNGHNNKANFETNSEPLHGVMKKGEMSHNHSYSNNASLNLSIHTAEEFSIEMLSWLKNEANGNKMINDENVEKIDNATLV